MGSARKPQLRMLLFVAVTVLLVASAFAGDIEVVETYPCNENTPDRTDSSTTLYLEAGQQAVFYTDSRKYDPEMRCVRWYAPGESCGEIELECQMFRLQFYKNKWKYCYFLPQSDIFITYEYGGYYGWCKYRQPGENTLRGWPLDCSPDWATLG